MRSMRMLWIGLAAAIAMGAIAASASAALPEFGRCIPAAEPKTGEYIGPKCGAKQAEHHGAWDFAPGPGAKPKFSGTGEKVSLETTGKLKIVCAAATFDGEYTGAKTETVTIDLIGCVNGTQKCESNPAKEGEIETQALEGTLGFIHGGEKPVVGLDIAPKAPSTNFVLFQCGKLPETSITTATVEGSLIAPVKPLTTMAEEFKLPYKVLSGKQAVQQFEGGVKDTLTAKLVKGIEMSTQEIGLRSLRVDVNEERMEIKAK
jgi:hypothetical protein